MIHIKTQSDFCETNVFWTVSYFDKRTHHPICKRYDDCNIAFEKFCFYLEQEYAMFCQYDKCFAIIKN